MRSNLIPKRLFPPRNQLLPADTLLERKRAQDRERERQTEGEGERESEGGRERRRETERECVIHRLFW